MRLAGFDGGTMLVDAPPAWPELTITSEVATSGSCAST
jgi:hypothetical protein